VACLPPDHVVACLPACLTSDHAVGWLPSHHVVACLPACTGAHVAVQPEVARLRRLEVWGGDAAAVLGRALQAAAEPSDSPAAKLWAALAVESGELRGPPQGQPVVASVMASWCVPGWVGG
jgi:hypothetical protein